MKFNVTVGLNENETKLAQAADFINLYTQRLSACAPPAHTSKYVQVLRVGGLLG